MVTCARPLFCVCDRCLGATAAEHQAADARCGREWLCQCGACKRTREVLADIDARFARIKELEAQLVAVRAIKAGS